MRVIVKLFGALAEYLPKDSNGRKAVVDLSEGATPFDLIQKLGIPYEVEEGTLVVTVNDSVVDHFNYFLKEGDEVSIFPPLQGG